MLIIKRISFTSSRSSKPDCSNRDAIVSVECRFQELHPKAGSGPVTARPASGDRARTRKRGVSEPAVPASSAPPLSELCGGQWLTPLTRACPERRFCPWSRNLEKRLARARCSRPAGRETRRELSLPAALAGPAVETRPRSPRACSGSAWPGGRFLCVFSIKVSSASGPVEEFHLPAVSPPALPGASPPPPLPCQPPRSPPWKGNHQCVAFRVCLALLLRVRLRLIRVVCNMGFFLS